MVILTRFKDWDRWFWKLQANISPEIWPYINSEAEERNLLDLPVRPEPANFSAWAQTYAELSTVHQKSYDNICRYYNQDMKYYSCQCDQLQAAWAYITVTVSDAKKIMLDPKLSIQEWLLDLKQSTESPKNYMLMQTETLYQDILRSFKPRKLHWWLEKWEATMIECIKYDLPEMQNDCWLQDLAQWFEPVSEVYSMQFTKNASDKIKSNPWEFWRVARELREMIQTQKNGAFHVRFESTESSEKDSEASIKKTEQASLSKGQKRWKRSGIQSLKSNNSKKAGLECPACDMREHSLSECWCIFEELKPKRMKLPAYHIQKMKRAIENDDELMKQIEKIHQDSPWYERNQSINWSTGPIRELDWKEC